MGQFLFRNGQWVSIERIIEQNKKIDNNINIIMVDRPIVKKKKAVKSKKK